MKRILTTLLQILISVGLIYWIFRDPTKRADMAEALRQADLRWFIPGIAAMLAVLALQAFRWFVLLRAIGIRLSLWRTTQLYLIGSFFNLFLLGATGGDVVKIFYAMREAGPDKAAAFLSIALDRVIGLLALAAVSAVVIALNFQAYMSTPIAQGLLATIAVILGGAVGVTVVAALVALLRLENRLPKWMPLRQAVVDLAIATQRYASQPGALLAAFAISLPAHLLLFSTFYFAGRAFASGLSVGNVFSVMPIVNTITSLPISFSGIGVREQLFDNLLDALYGVPAATSTLVSMGGYLIAVACCLLGGIVYLTYRPSDGRAGSLREMTEATKEVAQHPSA